MYFAGDNLLDRVLLYIDNDPSVRQKKTISCEIIYMDFELSVSMMCADYGNLEKEIKELEDGGIEFIYA